MVWSISYPCYEAEGAWPWTGGIFKIGHSNCQGDFSPGRDGADQGGSGGNHSDPGDHGRGFHGGHGGACGGVRG